MSNNYEFFIAGRARNRENVKLLYLEIIENC